MNPNIFREYDIRGIYPEDFNEKAAIKIAQAFAFLYPEARKIVVARDSRLSSPSLAKALIGVLKDSGIEVINIGLAPDPLFYFSIFHYHFDGGIMVSGSHNSKEYNGLMLSVWKSGEKNPEDIIGKDLKKIKDIVLKGKIDTGKKKKISGKEILFNPAPDYIDYVASKIRLKRPLKIIIDSSNGACGFLPEKVFKKLNCEVETIFGEPDGNFPNHLPDPYDEKNLEIIRKKVLSRKADLGFCYDTDGDRVGVIDNKGRVVNGDSCLLLLSREALKKKKGPIVHDMRVSKAFLDELKKEGVKTYFSVSHHSAVIEKIIETKAVFGGEITLHFLFPLDYYLCDEAIFASLKIAEAASQKTDFAEYADSLPRYFASPEIFIESTDKEKFKLIAKLQRYLRRHNYDFNDIDGARINFKNGWALARAANTSPIIKCRFEGETEAGLAEVKKQALEIFKKVGIPVRGCF